MGLSNKLSYEAGSFSCCHLNPHGVFNLRFEALFPHAGALDCVVCLAPWLFLPVYLHEIVALPSLQSATLLGPLATTLPQVLSVWLPVSAPPTGLDECFFISLVVGLPYSLIFCQFLLFFVFKLLLSFFWLCEEAQCVYLCLHLGWKSFQKPLFIEKNLAGTLSRMVVFSHSSRMKQQP